MVRLLASATLIVALASAAAAAPRDAPEKAADSPDKIICKRFTETGSLAKSSRICKTKLDWERERANAQASLGASGGPGSAANSGN